MEVVTSHKNLKAWQEAMSLVVDVYDATRLFPRDEAYALTSQMRRAAVSIPSNIAEGAGRFGCKEFSRFLGIALGSVAELETQIEIAFRIGYIKTTEELMARIRFLRILIRRLIESVESR